MTLVPTDNVELSHLPHGPTRTSSDGDASKDPRSKSLDSTNLDDRTPEFADAHPIWRRRLNNLRNKHPRIWRVYEWLRGPVPPVNLQPTPILDTTSLRWRNHAIHINPSLESWWLKHTNIFRHKLLLILFSAVYIIGLAFISRDNSFLTPADSFITCTATYWLKDDGCGLNGQSCSPFTGPDFGFRCPGDCLSVTLANQRAVGAEEVVYTSLVVGGGDNNKTYRGDSWICPAAIQA